MNEFEKIRKEGRLAFEYIRGSHLYNLNTATSDVDTGGVFLCTREQLLGLSGYKSQVSDERHDNTWFEIGELLRLLMKSNPTVLELLFVPESKMLVKPDPLMRLILDNRDKFVTKQCFNPFFGYAKSQIEKARGLNKKIVNPIERRLSPLEFTYTFKGQGSQPILSWLNERGLNQRHCGLVKIPNMRDIFGVHYDFGAHRECMANWENDSRFIRFARNYFHLDSEEQSISRITEEEPKGYRGIFGLEAESNEARLSSIEDKCARPICHISYNQDAYSQHCRQFSEYQRWVKERNPERYKSNLNKNYDSKNMMHMFRLIHMASEIAEGRGIILERTEDREFLLDVRNHKFEYEELMNIVEEETERMNSLMKSSSIPEQIDTDFVNNLMIDIRNKQLESRI